MSPTAAPPTLFFTQKEKLFFWSPFQNTSFIVTVHRQPPVTNTKPASLSWFSWPLTPSASFCINSHSIRLDSTLLSLNKVLGTRDLDNKSSVNYLRMAISILLGSTPIWTFINQYKSSIINNNTCFTSRAKKKEWKGQPKKSKKSMSPHFEGGKPFNDPLVFNSFKQLLRNGHHSCWSLLWPVVLLSHVWSRRKALKDCSHIQLLRLLRRRRRKRRSRF